MDNLYNINTMSLFYKKIVLETLSNSLWGKRGYDAQYGKTLF